jgi:hypothetical protein
VNTFLNMVRMLTNIFCREKLAKEAALMKEKKTDVQEEEEGLKAYYNPPPPPPTYLTCTGIKCTK